MLVIQLIKTGVNKMKTSLNDAIKKAVETNNGEVAGRCADVLRFKFGFNFKETYEYFNKLTGITLAGYDQLMYDADEGY